MTIPRLSPNGPEIVLASSRKVFDNGPSGNAILIDWSKSRVQHVFLTGNAAITAFKGLPIGESVDLYLGVRQDTVGNRVPTFPGAYTPAAGLAFSTGALQIDWLHFLYTGEQLLANFYGKNFQ